MAAPELVIVPEARGALGGQRQRRRRHRRRRGARSAARRASDGRAGGRGGRGGARGAECVEVVHDARREAHVHQTTELLERATPSRRSLDASLIH